MKILYGIQGTGNGHISRCRLMAKYLSENNLDVTYLVSGREKEKLFEMDIFGSYLHRRGLTFVTKNGNIDYLASALKNNVLKFISEIRELDLSQYDLVITDFEPITAWAAKLAGKKTIAIGHQYAFGENTPIKNESLLAKTILQRFAPADIEIGLHWERYSSLVMPPIIDVSLSNPEPEDYILVYLPFENQQTVISTLKKITHQNFIIYSPDLEDTKLNNLKLKKTSYSGFKKDLKNCAGVICNSGFELNSECIHLNLPILTKPIIGQMEQESNALALSQLGLGTAVNVIDVDTINMWLLEKKNKLNPKYPDVAKELVNWIKAGATEDPKKIADKLWSSLAKEL